MPTYRYECADGHPFELVCSIAEMENFENGRCACDCGRRLQRDYRVRKHVSFHEGFYEHISEEGIHISSMSELKRVARENGNYSNYADDLGGAFPGSKEGRWI